jgi:hypothetical protein
LKMFWRNIKAFFAGSTRGKQNHSSSEQS